MRAAEQDRLDVAQKRRLWRNWRRFMDASRFVFLNETATATTMARRYGRCPAFERLMAAVPYDHWHTTTFIAGRRQTGIIAPLVLDGPMTGPAFRAYVEQFLAPALEPGDVVVLDTSRRIRSMVSARRSPRRGPRSSTCRPTDRISTRSSSYSPSSRRSCARQRRGPKTSSGLAGHRPPPRRRPAK